MNDDAVSHDAPTVPAIPLRARQRHRARSKKQQSSRWLARQTLPAGVIEELPLASATFETVTPPPVSVANESPEEAWEHGAEEFFAAGDSISPVALQEALHEPPPPVAGLEGPRRGLTAIVVGAVALAGVLCAAAALKVHPPAPGGPRENVVTASAPGEPVVTARENAPRPSVVAAPTDTSTGPTAAAVDARSEAGAPAPVAGPPAVATAPSASPKELREEARGLLTRRRIADAIVAADQATKADPADAEGWLLLGAAQLDAGRSSDARASFRTCARTAKVGPVGECRAFAR